MSNEEGGCSSLIEIVRRSMVLVWAVGTALLLTRIPVLHYRGTRPYIFEWLWIWNGPPRGPALTMNWSSVALTSLAFTVVMAALFYILQPIHKCHPKKENK